MLERADITSVSAKKLYENKRSYALVGSVNPLKMYEYLVIGKPVVMIPMDEVNDYAQILTIAGPSDFAKGIEKAYEEDTEVKRTKSR